MGAAEFISKGQSQHASTEQDFLDILSRRDEEDSASISAQVPPGPGDWGTAKHAGLQAGGSASSGSFQFLFEVSL